jgi:hypothetical protein
VPDRVSALHKVELVVHAIGAGVLVGSSTHLSLQALALLRGRARPRLLRLYPPVALAAWATVFLVGALAYPHYRVHVRHEYLDIWAVWASVLFDIKENLAIFVGPLLAAAWWMSGMVSEEDDRTLRRWFAASCISASAIAWINAVSGLLITSVRSI